MLALLFWFFSYIPLCFYDCVCGTIVGRNWLNCHLTLRLESQGDSHWPSTVVPFCQGWGGGGRDGGSWEEQYGHPHLRARQANFSVTDWNACTRDGRVLMLFLTSFVGALWLALDLVLPENMCILRSENSNYNPLTHWSKKRCTIHTHGG